MCFKDVIALLEDKGIWYKEFFIPTDSNNVEVGYKGVFTKDVAIWTEENDSVSKIIVLGDIPTTLALKKHDSADVMTDLYGADYTNYDMHGGNQLYEYAVGNYYFQVIISYGEVYNWRISKEKYTAINPNAINSMIGSNNVGNKLLVNELENEDSILYLGMSLDESSLWLDSIGKWHEKYFTPTDPDDFSIGYNEVDKVCGILIKNDMSTKLGLKRGDLKDDMVELYGENYTLYERINGNEVYEYKFDKHYLFVDIYEGEVDNWRISTHSYVEE